MSRRYRVAIAGAIALILALGLVIVGSSGRAHNDPVVVMDLPAGRVAGGAAVGDSVVVVLTEETGNFDGRTTLVRLDGATGAERGRVELAGWSAFDEVATVDGDLVLRLRGRLPDVPGPEVRWTNPPSLTGEFWLAVVDGASLTPVHQYQLPLFDLGAWTSIRTHEPLVVIDGVYWMLGAGLARGRIDLRTGETFFEDSLERGSIRGVVSDGEHLAIVELTMVSVQDLATGANVINYRRDDVPEMEDDLAVLFWAHEGEIWIEHAWKRGEGLPRRLDLGVANDPDLPVTVDEQPSTTIPDWVFESGGYRWELVRNDLVVHVGVTPPPERHDRWRQVDPATNEVLGEFSLGTWQPRFATSDHLWLTRERVDGPGRELARLVLER